MEEDPSARSDRKTAVQAERKARGALKCARGIGMRIVTKRLDHWRQVVSRTVAPVSVTCGDPDGFRAEMRGSTVGAVQLSTMATSPVETHRTPTLIRQSGPDTVQALLLRRGRSTVTQEGKRAQLRPSELLLYYTS